MYQYTFMWDKTRLDFCKVGNVYVLDWETIYKMVIEKQYDTRLVHSGESKLFLSFSETI